MGLARLRSLAFLVLVCLLFAQWAAGAHALTHLPAAHAAAEVLDAPDGDGKGAAHVCLECLAGQGLDSAAPAAVRGLTLPVVRDRPAQEVCAAPAHGPRLGPNSRAPPAFF